MQLIHLLHHYLSIQDVYGCVLSSVIVHTIDTLANNNLWSFSVRNTFVFHNIFFTYCVFWPRFFLHFIMVLFKWIIFVFKNQGQIKRAHTFWVWVYFLCMLCRVQMHTPLTLFTPIIMNLWPWFSCGPLRCMVRIRENLPIFC